LGYVWDVEIGGWRDVWETASLPMMFESREQAIACGEQVIKPFLNKVGEKDNIILLQLTTDFPEEIWCKDVVSSVADLNGKKIRAASIADQTVIKELGGVPVSLDYGEVVMAGERGVCDMAITSVASGYADKWYEVYKNLYLWGCSMARECTLINRDAFLELPKEWQDLVVKSAKTMLEDPLNRARDEIVRKAIQDIEAAGGKAVQPTLADRQVLSAAGVKVQKGWTQDEKRSNDAKELYQLILNFKAK
jgi:TRAP-type C4-dicarboxylate transport system substrate-binding protein